MKIRTLYFIIPALTETGPIRGVIALANQLCSTYQIEIFLLKGKQTSVKTLGINENIVFHDLKELGWLKKIRATRQIIEQNHSPLSTVYSCCFSADFFSFFLSKRTIKIASIRSNLSTDYSFQLPVGGKLLALFHYTLLKRFNSTIAISTSMHKELVSRNFKNTVQINNFVDENFLEQKKITIPIFDSSLINFIFLGSLTKRKRPDLLLKIASTLKNTENKFHIHLVGNGCLADSLTQEVKDKNLSATITFWGFQENPYPFIQCADYMILPSESEGAPRAVLESLYYGTPVIMRNVDAASEIVISEDQGFLFDSDEELHSIIEKILTSHPKVSNTKNCKLPPAWRMNFAVEKTRELINTIQEQQKGINQKSL